MLSIDLLRYQSMNQNSIEGKYRKGRIFNFDENSREDEDCNEIHTDSNKGANLYTSVEEYQKSLKSSSSREFSSKLKILPFLYLPSILF